MYTRCPSCRAEISFEPPANMETLPDGYKHRIKCPSCGVTIGVKINKIDTQAATLVQPAPAYNQPQTNFEPVYANEAAQAPAKKAKHSGVGRNVVMMIMSLLFIAISVVGFLVKGGIIENSLFGIEFLDGVSGWIDLFKGGEDLQTWFDISTGAGIIYVLPMALLLLAVVNFLVALISACGKKYGRAYNVVSSILIGGIAITMMFYLLFIEGGDIAEYFTALIDEGMYMFFASAGLGLLQLIFGLCFTKSLERKEKKSK